MVGVCRLYRVEFADFSLFLMYMFHIHLRIECILLKFHWGMKALTEVHFQWSAIGLHVENVLRSTLSYRLWLPVLVCSNSSYPHVLVKKRVHQAKQICCQSKPRAVWCLIPFLTCQLTLQIYVVVSCLHVSFTFVWHCDDSICKISFTA